MKIAACLLALLFIPLVGIAAGNRPPREELRLDDGWLFKAGADDTAATLPTAGKRWRPVQLPHDWSIEGRVSILAPNGNNGGFFPNGEGWYRRELRVPAGWEGRQVQLRFDGIYMNAEVWLDGRKLAYHPYGYTPLVVDLGGGLKPGDRHLLAVRVDNSRQPNTRWYSGSGIYRHAWLVGTQPVAIAPWGVFASTRKAGPESAELESLTRVANKLGEAAVVRVTQSLCDASGKVLAEQASELNVPAGAEADCRQLLTVAKPALWSPESPTLHRLLTRVWRGDSLSDEVTTNVGLRTVRTSPTGGFELNGRRVVLNGGNVHHDNGPLGAAAFDRAEQRKAELLKAAGYNAVRTSHNPPSPAFLEACDRLGLLVMDEAFDGWEKRKNKQDYGVHFKEWSRRDLQAMVLRDRNHPSVICWSIGNEVYERGSPDGYRIAAELAAGIRELDTTRPVTAGINNVPGNWEATDPLFGPLDLAGYNYETARHVADHARLPGRTIVLTESYQNEAFANWAACTDFSYVVGDFVWSAIDYLGEAGIGRVYPPGETPTDHWVSDQFPWHGAACGDIDLTGWRKPSSHYRQIVWDAGQRLYAAVQVPSPSGKPWGLTKWSMPPSLSTWSWPGCEGRALKLEVYSRHSKVRVLLNGRAAGEAETGRAQEFKALFSLAWEPGEVVIEGLDASGQVAERFRLADAGPVAALKLQADRTSFSDDGQDLCYVSVELTDAKGTWQPHTDLPVTYSVEGPARIAGIGSGDLTNPEAYWDNPRRSHQGRALVILRGTGKGGKIVLRAQAPGLPASELRLRAE